MARNYMQDITPMREEPERRAVPVRRIARPEPQEADYDAPVPSKSIRNIAPTPRSRPMPPPPPRREAAHPVRRSRWGIWLAVVASLLVLGGASFMMLFPSTTVTITPHTHVVPFDAGTILTAYPAETAAQGTIPYTVLSETFEDSVVVPANGVENVSEKASGTVTVYNEYSDQPVRLIKNTRFESPNGLIFRVQNSIDVPGRRGSTPGSIDVTVFADQSGADYNLGPTDKFTVPGLKSSPDMYAGVYAKSSAAFTGGFVGERPAVEPATLDAARAQIRTRLNERAQALPLTAPLDVIALPGLVAVRYDNLPITPEAGGGVRVTERAIVSIPVFPRSIFAQIVGQAVSASAEGQSIDITFASDISAQSAQALGPTLGQEPLQFAINGRTMLIWRVNHDELRSALAGREESTFESIIGNFPGISAAEARITPPWKSTFPSTPSDIQVIELPPPATF